MSRIRGWRKSVQGEGGKVVLLLRKDVEGVTR